MFFLYDDKVLARFEPSDWGDLSALTEKIEEKPGQFLKLVELQLSRSLAGTNFSPRMSVEDFGKVERQVKEALKKLPKNMSGLYLSLESSTWSTEMVTNLSSDQILFDHNASMLEAPVR